jgi:spore germination protein (amino acid permease)
MNKSNQYSIIHFILLMMTSVGLLNHVIIIPPLAGAAKRDAWLSAICTLVVFLVVICIFLYIMRSTQQKHISVWLNTQFGPIPAYTFNVLMSAYLVTAIYVTVNDLANWTSITYLQDTPRIIIGGSLLALGIGVALTDMLTIIIVNSILLPFIVVLGFFVDIPNKDYSYLLPVFEHGITPMIHGMVYSGAGTIELIAIILLQHHIKQKVRYYQLAITVLILIWLTLGPTMGAIAAFGPIEVAIQRFPAFELWGLVKLGIFIEHLDFFSIYQWLSGAFVRLSLCGYLVVELLFPHGSKPKRRKRFLLIVFVGITGAILLPISDTLFVYILSEYYLPSSLVLLTALLLFLATMSFIANRKRGVIR